MNNWLFGSSEYINLMCYCSHKFKEAWKQKAIFGAELFASVKLRIFTCKDFLMSMSFPLNPKTSPLCGSNPDQWRYFCAIRLHATGTMANWFKLAKAECLLAASLEKACCPCSFTNVESMQPLKTFIFVVSADAFALRVPGKIGRNHWCCCVVGDQKGTVTFLSSSRQSAVE